MNRLKVFFGFKVSTKNMCGQKEVTDMATFSRKGWSSDGVGGSFSSDEYTRYMDDIDDARMLRHDRGSRPGKTIHPHPTFTEVIEVDERAKFAGLMEEAKKGNVKAQFLLGKEYISRGDLREAEYWLRKVAALGGWPEAEAELSRVRQLRQLRTQSCDENVAKAMHGAHSVEAIKVVTDQGECDSKKGTEEHPFLKLPRAVAFEICDIAMRKGEKKYLVLVRRKGGTKMEVMGHILREAGFDVATDLFDTELDAQNAGLLALRSWGRRISQEKEARLHLRDGIEKFLADISK